VWQDFDGREVWLARVDPDTGYLVPPDGRGTLLDLDVAPISVGRNGPEWVEGEDGPWVTWSAWDPAYGYVAVTKALPGPRGRVGLRTWLTGMGAAWARRAPSTPPRSVPS
jgi:hypothetical protein